MPPIRKNKNNKSCKDKSEKASLDTMSVTALKKKIRDIERYLKTVVYRLAFTPYDCL
jgi:hypothetical protein